MILPGRIQLWYNLGNVRQEIELTKFRREENANKLIGGNIADEPFPMALRCLAVKKGFKSQLALAKALRKEHSTTVNGWYTGKHIPVPGEFGNLLILLKPNDEELDLLVEPYAKLLREGKGGKGGDRFKSSIRQIIPAENPVGQWIEEICKKRGITISEFYQSLGYGKGFHNRRRIGLAFFNDLIQNAQKILSLSEEEIESLARSTALEKEQRLAQGYRIQDTQPSRVLTMQKKIKETTYNGSQAGKELGISREMVRLLRKKLNLPLVQREEQMQILRERLEKTKGTREKMRKAQQKNLLNA